MNHYHLGDIELASARMDEALSLADSPCHPIAGKRPLGCRSPRATAPRPCGRPPSRASRLGVLPSIRPCFERFRLRVQLAQLAVDLAESSYCKASIRSSSPIPNSQTSICNRLTRGITPGFHQRPNALLPLAWVRLGRLTHRDEDRMVIIKETLNRTSDRKDNIGHGKALIAYADELHPRPGRGDPGCIYPRVRVPSSLVCSRSGIHPHAGTPAGRGTATLVTAHPGQSIRLPNRVPSRQASLLCRDAGYLGLKNSLPFRRLLAHRNV